MSGYKLSMQFKEEGEPFLLDISSLLYDIELTHDFSVLLLEEEYQYYEFNQYFWYRNGRPVKQNQRVRASRIIKESPLLLEIVIPTIGAVWGIIKIFEKVSNWDLEKEKLELEVRKLRREEYAYKEEVIERHIQQLDHIIEERNAKHHSDKLLEKLSENSIKLDEISISRNNDLEIESSPNDKPPSLGM